MSVRYAIKELLIRHHRTMVNCIGIAVAVALIISLYSLSSAYKEAVRKPFAESGVDLVLERPKTEISENTRTSGVILPDSAMPISSQELQSLMDIEGIESIAASLQIWSFDKGSFKVIVGIDPNSPPIGPAMYINQVSDGSFFEADGESVAVIEKNYRHSMKQSGAIDDNNMMEIAGEQFEIIGTIEAKEGSQLAAPNLFIPISEARRLAGLQTDDVNTIYIRLDNAADSKQIMEQISAAIPGVNISSPDSSLSVADSLFALSEQFIMLISILVVIVAAALIFKTVSSNISERKKEIGIMKAVGWTTKNVRAQITLEILIQSVLGSLVGLAGGLALSFGLSMIKISAPLPWQGNPIPNATMNAAVSDLVSLHVTVSPMLIVAALVGTVVIALLCSLIATQRVGEIKPASLLRTL